MTHNEIIAEIEAALRAQLENTDSDGCVTVPQLARELKWGEAKARRMIRRLIEEGKVEPTRVVRPNMNGRPQPRDAYRLVK